jgi:hypothetical protein
MARPPRWVTTQPAGYLPAGMVVDVVHLTNTGGPTDGNRDSYTGDPGDGQWIRVRYPHSMILAGHFPGPAEMTAELGIEPTDLKEITP